MIGVSARTERMRKIVWGAAAAGMLFATLALLGPACSSSDPGGGGGSSSGIPGDGAAGDGSPPGSDGSSSGSDGSSGADGSIPQEGGADADAAGGPFTLTSTAFAAGAMIPAAHANPFCNAANGNASPPLTWSNAPAGTQSFAVTVRDLSVPAGSFHWVIYDIPGAESSLPQGIEAVASPPTPAGAKQTYWAFGATYSYQGPCPQPAGSTHNYRFTVHSFSTPTIPVTPGETSPTAADAVIQANETGHAELVGTYKQL